MIDKQIIKTFASMEKRGWNTIYWAIDIHDTIVRANYSTTELPTDFCPFAKATLRQLSARKDCVLILFTCSHQKEIDQYLEFFDGQGIHFKYVNENPEVPNTTLGCFDDKFYTNLYLDDKAGFDADTDWQRIYKILNTVLLEEEQ